MDFRVQSEGDAVSDDDYVEIAEKRTKALIASSKQTRREQEALFIKIVNAAFERGTAKYKAAGLTFFTEEKK